MLHKNKLIELCIAEESGQYGVPYPAEEYDSSKYRYLRITDISDDGCLLDNDLKSVSGDNIDSYILSENDIVFARTGNSTGRSYLYDKRHGLLVFAGFLIRYKIDQSKINPKYLHYFTNSSYYKQWVKNLSNGSTRGNINAQTFADCDIIYPDRQQQDNLVNTLSAIDEKIALNTRMNKELEAMAKQLYDYWFVQFDFPDENGRPYKSSGGKMIYNPSLKREIPAGWEDCELKDLTEVINGATPLTTNIENYGDDIIWITPNDLSNQKNKFISCGERSISQKGYDSCSTSLMPVGAVLMSSRAPIGLMAIAEVELCTNQGFKSFVPFDMSDNYFLYYYIQEHMPQIEQLGAGTTFREVSRDTMLKFPILKINDRDLYIKWHKQIDAISKEQINLLHQIRNLTHLRDSLLPMLMNGQVTV